MVKLLRAQLCRLIRKHDQENKPLPERGPRLGHLPSGHLPLGHLLGWRSPLRGSHHLWIPRRLAQVRVPQQVATRPVVMVLTPSSQTLLVLRLSGPARSALAVQAMSLLPVLLLLRSSRAAARNLKPRQAQERKAATRPALGGGPRAVWDEHQATCHPAPHPVAAAGRLSRFRHLAHYQHALGVAGGAFASPAGKGLLAPALVLHHAPDGCCLGYDLVQMCDW